MRIARPFDAHLHLRDGAALEHTLRYAASQCWGAVVMPNLKPPLTSLDAVLAYRQKIEQVQPGFGALVSLYLTPELDEASIREARRHGVLAAKLYPQGVTTGSQAGVSSIESVYPQLEWMEEEGLVLQVHGESPDPAIDIFDREAHFIEHSLAAIFQRFPKLRIVFEHATTAEAVEFVAENPGHRLACTITPQHLLYNRNDLFGGNKVRPHRFCLPVLKRERHREALVRAATSGSPKFFMGTDSAPHAVGDKECGAGCAGCFSSPLALELYAMVFEKAGALDKLEDFCSRFGPSFYGLESSSEQLELERSEWTVPTSYPLGGTKVVPLAAGSAMPFRVRIV